MQPRKHPRQIPNKPHYFTFEISGVGQTAWRIPSMVKSARLIALLKTSGVMEASANAENGEDIITNMGDKLTALFSCQGALIGMCWFDENLNLDTAIDSFRNLETFGEAVFEELHESCWSTANIQEAFVFCVQKVVESYISQQEVAEKVDFLGQPPDNQS